MPKRTDIKSILIIGAGPIVIGQACEFDYSGTQACKALKEEGYRTILVNSNPATIMTDPNLADITYIEPLTIQFLTKIIEKERPCALLPTVGGQTALNLALELEKQGVLREYNVELIGANARSIEKAEDRALFIKAMANIGLECPKNAIVKNIDDAREALKEIGLPAIIRPSFTLGGSGGGIARTEEEFFQIVHSGLEASPTNQVQIDESVLGWKEFEMEVIRDKADNCIIVCSIENVDPMGVHTGDSITVAPALTLTDKEYQIMRDASIKVLREIGVDTGGSNVQFAVNPENGKILIIEMNPRVSRSSALASKATGFPIAKVAAKLAVGYTLDEIPNDCTKITPASFEPTIDYIVTKIPRFTFEKFAKAEKLLSSSMKSVGEAMAIGRSFKESMQKALRSLEIGLHGLDETYGILSKDEIREKLRLLIPNRILLIADAIRAGLDLAEIQKLTSYDFWFLSQIKEIIETERKLASGAIKIESFEDMLFLKNEGFSDARIAKILGQEELYVREIRYNHRIHPSYKMVDTCSGEFSSKTPYLYSTYEGSEMAGVVDESNVSAKDKVIILGGGPNRIGQGIEFDYACVHASYSLREIGIETIMINCNPETVSTDYDTSDRLYFEPLVAEDVIEICKAEQRSGRLLGVNIQFGGQTPLKLAEELEKHDIRILGTSPDSIDLAEDRERFKQFLQELNVKQPVNYTCNNREQVLTHASDVGFPLVVRPSYVLGGRAMEIVYDIDALKSYLDRNEQFFSYGPILLDRFLTDAIEIDVDAIADGDEVFVAGVMEHIEEAGIHSGDSACSLPPYSLSPETIDEIKDLAEKIAKSLKVVGLMNIQFAVQHGQIYVLEVNPRASRTVPFVAKSISIPLAKIASQIMVGRKLKDFGLNMIHSNNKNGYITVKCPVFPFAKFANVDTILGPEMQSTGEVMGVDRNFGRAYAKSFIAAGNKIPLSGTAFISVKDSDKQSAVSVAQKLQDLGFKIVATGGTHQFLKENNIASEKVNKVREGSPHIVDMMERGEIALVINTSEGKKSISDSFSIRRTCLMQKIPYQTTISGSRVLASSIKTWLEGAIEVFAVQNY